MGTSIRAAVGPPARRPESCCSRKRHVASGPTRAIERPCCAATTRSSSTARMAAPLVRGLQQLRGADRPPRPRSPAAGSWMALRPRTTLPAMRDTIVHDAASRGQGGRSSARADLEARGAPALAVDGLGRRGPWETDTGYGDPAGVSQAYAARRRPRAGGGDPPGLPRRRASR